MHAKSRTIIVATGGSGGHVIPAESLAQKLKNLGCHVKILGHDVSTNRFFSDSHVLKEDIEASPISIKLFHKFFFKSFKGVNQALKAFKKTKPDLVVGFGSYHCFPVLFAALIKRIPIALYEANTSMGKVIKLFSKKAKLVASPFDFYNHMSNFVHVKPLIRQLLGILDSRENALDYFGLSDLKKTILIMGGSQGSKFFNTRALKKIVQTFDPQSWQIIHITGPTAIKEAISVYYEKLGFVACVKNYETNMTYAYLAADLVICRSGATTIFELALFQKPSFLIPFPQAKDNHQYLNAIHFTKHAQSCVICEELFETCDLMASYNQMLHKTCQSWDKYFESPQSLENRLMELC